MFELSQDYLEDFLARMAYNSSAIEGNKTSLAETVSILLYDTIPGKTNKRDFYEIENHKYAFEFIFYGLKEKNPMSIYTIKKIHEKLTDHLQHDKGQFKKQSNRIKGSDFDTAPPEQVSILMKQWVDNLNYRLENAKDEEEKIIAILDQHIQFERIHPFSDGNGRTGRMVMNYSLLENNLPPIIIPVELKPEYIKGLADQNAQELYETLKPLIEKEKEIIKSFENKEKVLIKDNEKKDKKDIER